jgi:hypothetical protein
MLTASVKCVSELVHQVGSEQVNRDGKRADRRNCDGESLEAKCHDVERSWRRLNRP